MNDFIWYTPDGTVKDQNGRPICLFEIRERQQMNEYELTLVGGDVVTVWGDTLLEAIAGTTIGHNEIISSRTVEDFPDNANGS